LPCRVALLGYDLDLVRCRAGLGGRLGLNSFIQTRQMYTYEIPMGNRVWIIASQTHTRLPNGWRFCPISIPMGTIFVPYPYPNRGIPHGLAGIGSPLTSLGTMVLSHDASMFFFLLFGGPLHCMNNYETLTKSKSNKCIQKHGLTSQLA
jgi:hypothetical protein